jgi:hypothetical protein
VVDRTRELRTAAGALLLLQVRLQLIFAGAIALVPSQQLGASFPRFVADRNIHKLTATSRLLPKALGKPHVVTQGMKRSRRMNVMVFTYYGRQWHGHIDETVMICCSRTPCRGMQGYTSNWPPSTLGTSSATPNSILRYASPEPSRYVRILRPVLIFLAPVVAGQHMYTVHLAQSCHARGYPTFWEYLSASNVNFNALFDSLACTSDAGNCAPMNVARLTRNRMRVPYGKSTVNRPKFRL